MQNVPGLFTAWRAAEIGWALFFELQLDDGPVRFTSSVRDLSYDGQTWRGDGTLLGINFAEVRLSELGGSFEVTISGVVGPDAVANGLLDRLGKDLRGVRLQNREARAFMAKVSRDGTVSDVIEQASGTVDTFTRSLSPVDDGEEAIITLNLERGALLGRGLKPRRLDLATHQEITPGSTALRQASQLPKLEGVAGKSKLKRRQKRTVAADVSVSAFSHVLGRTLIEGEEVHRELSEDAGGNKDRWYYQVRVLSCSPITSIRKIWVGDEEVPITNEDENPEDGFTAPSGHRLHKKVRFKFHLGGDLGGTDQMHQKWGNPGANDDFSPFPVVQILLSFEIPGGIPQVRFEVDGAPLPDFRDPAQDPMDPSTWVYSRNPIVQSAWLVQQSFTFADRPSRIDLDLYQTYADICDELVSRGPVGGTEARYTSGLVVSEDDEPSELLQEILASCGGDFVEPLGGIGWIFYAAAWTPPVVALSQADILEGERTYSPQSIDEGERFTLVRGKFLDAENRFVELSAPAATSPEIKAEEWGDLAQWLADNPTASDAVKMAAADQYRDFETEISVDGCGSVTQMQRLQWIVLEASRRGALYEASFGIAAATLPPGVRITLTDADNGIDALTFRVIARQIENLEEEPGVTLTLVEDDEGVYALPVLRPRNPSGTEMSFPVLPSGRGSLPGIESVRITDWGTRIQFSPRYFADPAGFPAILHAGLYLEAYLTTQSGLDAQGIINDALNTGLHGEAPQGANVLIDGVTQQTTYSFLLRLMDRSDGVIDYGASLLGSHTTGKEIPLEEGPAIVFTPETNEVGVNFSRGLQIASDNGLEPRMSSDGFDFGAGDEVILRTSGRFRFVDRDIDITPGGIDEEALGTAAVTGEKISVTAIGGGLQKDGNDKVAMFFGDGLQEGASGQAELRYDVSDFGTDGAGALIARTAEGIERSASGLRIPVSGVAPAMIAAEVAGGGLQKAGDGALELRLGQELEVGENGVLHIIPGNGVARDATGVRLRTTERLTTESGDLDIEDEGVDESKLAASAFAGGVRKDPNTGKVALDIGSGLVVDEVTGKVSVEMTTVPTAEPWQLLVQQFPKRHRVWTFETDVEGWVGGGGAVVGVATGASANPGGGGLLVTHSAGNDPRIVSPGIAEALIEPVDAPVVLVAVTPTTDPGASTVSPRLFWNQSGEGTFAGDSEVEGQMAGVFSIGVQTVIAFVLSTAANWEDDKGESYDDIRLDIGQPAPGGTMFDFVVNWVQIIGFDR